MSVTNRTREKLVDRDGTGPPGSLHFQGHVTESDGSVGLVRMGAGFVWLDRSKSGSERVGREEEGTSSGRVEMGVYTVILRRTPDQKETK